MLRKETLDHIRTEGQSDRRWIGRYVKSTRMIVTKWRWNAAGNLARLCSVIVIACYEYSSNTVCECCIQVMFSESLILFFPLPFDIRTRHVSGYQFKTFRGMKTRAFRDIMDKNCTLKQIWHLMDLLKQMFSDLYYPLQHICIDGRLILWKGVTALKEHTSAKWHRLEIKLFKAWNVKTEYNLISLISIMIPKLNWIKPEWLEPLKL